MKETIANKLRWKKKRELTGSGIVVRQVRSRAKVPRRNTVAKLKTGMWAETASAFFLKVFFLKSA